MGGVGFFWVGEEASPFVLWKKINQSYISNFCSLFWGMIFLIRWVFFSGSCKKTCLHGYSYLIYGPPLNTSHLNWKHLQWNNPKLINWLQVSSDVIHEMYLIDTKIHNSFYGTMVRRYAYSTQIWPKFIFCSTRCHMQLNVIN